jgi:hypothetical protein
MICFENITEKDIEEVLMNFSKKTECNYEELKYKIVYTADSNYVKLEIYDIDKKTALESDNYELKFENDGIYLKINDKNQDPNIISEKLVSLEIL